MCALRDPAQIAAMLLMIEALLQAKLSEVELLLRLTGGEEIRGHLRGVTFHCENGAGPLVCAIHLRGNHDSLQSIDGSKISEVVIWRR